jgi:hypothetical protein
MSGMNWNRPQHKTHGRETESSDGTDIPRAFLKGPQISQQAKAQLRAETEPLIEDFRKRQLQANGRAD